MADYVLERYRINRGLCRQCGEPAVPNQILCEPHKAVHKKAQKAWRQRAVQAGLCPGCGTRSPGEYYLCESCRARKNRARRLQRRIDPDVREKRREEKRKYRARKRAERGSVAA